MFELPTGGVVWVEPGMVSDVTAEVLSVPAGQHIVAVVAMASGRVHTVLDPNKDVAKRIAAEKSKRTSEISTALHALGARTR